jgi:membrane associated rhomboid family serine protease
MPSGKKRWPRHQLLLWLSLCIWVMTLGQRTVLALPELRSQSFSRSTTSSGNTVASTKGAADHSGGKVDYYARAASHHHDSAVVEANPDYIYYTPPSAAPTASSYSSEHEEWLRQQQQQEFTVSTMSGNKNEGSILDWAKHYLQDLRRLSPTLFWTTISCVSVFILWGMPLDAPFLAKLLVCSRDNVVATKGLSLLLPAVSHISFRHLLVNLVTLLRIGPSVRQEVLSTTTAIWPLLLGSAVASNALFLVKPGGGACLGLSGVTMSLIAVLASSFPNRMFGIVVGVIPVRLPARHILQVLLLVSALGSFAKRSQIAHLTHLGGLLYGIMYHEIMIKRKYVRTFRRQRTTSSIW